MNIKWNAKDYTDHFSFVHQYGEDVMGLLDIPQESFVVDLGCGNGALSRKLNDRGFRVLGVDASAEMIMTAKAAHPDLNFIQGDATGFILSEKADAIFSNAVFHWIDADRQEALIENVSEQLKTGGLLVCEFGGKGCAEAVHSGLEAIFQEHQLHYPRTFYFPTIGEYAPLLERYGLRVEYAVLFDRPTVQQTEDGLIDWINMFVKKPFEGMEPTLKQEILDEARERLRGKLFLDGAWVVDYVRIRIKARKL